MEQTTETNYKFEGTVVLPPHKPTPFYSNNEKIEKEIMNDAYMIY